MAKAAPWARSWDEFLKEKYGPEGGRTQVPNLNPKTRERYPKVEVFTLLKSDKSFLQRLLREFHQRQKRKKDEPKARKMKMNLPIPHDLEKIHERMKDAGQELFVVGGAVRDKLLGKPPKDYDLATGAEPDKVIEVLSKDPENKLDLTGKSFGVVRVKTPDGNEYEIATYRKDIGKGRRPEAVEFTTIEEDVKRRDLTINALFYDMDKGEVVDYVGGIDDLKNGVIRTVGNPKDRFDEDKLRVLRAARFVGRLGGKMDEDTADAIKSDPNLTEVSPERIRDEFDKGIRTAKEPRKYLDLMKDLGLLDQVFPGMKIDSAHFMPTKDLPVQLAGLLRQNDPKRIAKMLHEMKYPKREIEQTLYLLKLQNLDTKSASRLRKAHKAFKVSPVQIVQFARNTGKPDRKNLRAYFKYLRKPAALGGDELKARGLEGPEIGKAIQKAEEEAFEKLLKG